MGKSIGESETKKVLIEADKTSTLSMTIAVGYGDFIPYLTGDPFQYEYDGNITRGNWKIPAFFEFIDGAQLANRPSGYEYKFSLTQLENTRFVKGDTYRLTISFELDRPAEKVEIYFVDQHEEADFWTPLSPFAYFGKHEGGGDWPYTSYNVGSGTGSIAAGKTIQAAVNFEIKVTATEVSEDSNKILVKVHAPHKREYNNVQEAEANNDYIMMSYRYTLFKIGSGLKLTPAANFYVTNTAEATTGNKEITDHGENFYIYFDPFNKPYEAIIINFEMQGEGPDQGFNYHWDIAYDNKADPVGEGDWHWYATWSGWNYAREWEINAVALENEFNGLDVNSLRGLKLKPHNDPNENLYFPPTTTYKFVLKGVYFGEVRP
jgi:hypothetical protein